MMLRNKLREHGNILFRWRSYLPLVLLPLAIIAIWESGGFERWFARPVEHAWEVMSLGISLLGLLVRALTVGHAPAGTSGRNTRDQRAEVLNTTGLYSITRNPLYLGNFLVLLGFVLGIKVWWLVLIVSAAFALYYERIIYAEEAFLEQKFGTAYTWWADQTPVFIPNLRLWQPPNLPLSLRTVLRREYHGFYLIVVAFTLIELGHDVLAEGERLATWFHEGMPWIVFFCMGTLIFLILGTLKKHTQVLHVAGR